MRAEHPQVATTAAELVAQQAADQSRVVLRNLHELAELVRVRQLFDQIWQPNPLHPLVTVEQLRAFTHAGNYLCGAFDGDTLVGACLGFFSAPPGVGLHSHITGVAERVRARQVGYALKLHQRAWALRQGLSEISWTYDPLVRRNGYFNLVKLAARPREYLVDFYGDIDDAINTGQGSDRLFIRWELVAPAVVAACRGEWMTVDVDELTSAGAVTVLAESATGRPMVSRGASRSAAPRLVRVPADIEALRVSDPALAREWRTAVRDVLGELLAGGGRVSGFARAGWYMVERSGA